MGAHLNEAAPPCDCGWLHEVRKVHRARPHLPIPLITSSHLQGSCTYTSILHIISATLVFTLNTQSLVKHAVHEKVWTSAHRSVMHTMPAETLSLSGKGSPALHNSPR